MGISKLFKVPLKDSSDNTIGDLYKIIDPESIISSDKRVGVDALILLIECLTNGPILTDPNTGRVTLHINTLVNKLIKYPFKQLFVFDNVVKDDAKAETIKNRTHALKREVFNHISLKDAISDFKDILKLVGIPYVTSPEQVEAEAYLVELKRMGLIDYILTTDTDVLAYGEDMLIFKEQVFRLYKYQAIKDGVGLTDKQFKEMCVLLGTDFNKKVKGVSHLGMVDYVKGHHTLSNMTLEQRSTYFLFSLRVRIGHSVASLLARKPSFDNALIKYLSERAFTKLVQRLEKLLDK